MASPAAVLSVLVTANTGGAAANLTRLDRQLKGTAASANKSAATIAKGAKFGGLAIAGLGVAGVVAAAKWESSFAEVRKTVDASEKQFGQLEKGLRSLAKQIPVPATELADLAGQAGALGIKAKDLVKFTKTAAELGIATDLSAEDAANALARLSNIMGTSSKDFRRLGSTMVELGNSGASTESEIAEMALRLAKTGVQVGLSEAQVLSFSSALASVGVKAESGGSAFSRAFITMAEAVDKGGGDLAGFADVAGMSVGKFSGLFERDAALAMVAFTEGLGKVEKQGGSVFQTLESLELSEIRVRDALLGAAGSGDVFRKALETGSGEWKRNAALTEEAKRRYETVSSQFQVFKNRVNDLFITIGEFLEPVTRGLLKTVNQLLVGKGGIVEGARAIGAFARQSEVLGAVWEVVRRGVAMAWAGIKQVFRGGVKVISSAVDVIAGILTLDLGRAWKGLKGIFRGGIDVLIGIFRTATAPFRGAVEAIAGALRGPLVGVWKFIKGAFLDGADFILGVISTILDGMAAMADAGSKIPGPIGDMWDKVQAGAEDASDSINGFRETLRESESVSQKTNRQIGRDFGRMSDDAREALHGVSTSTGRELGKASREGRDKSGSLRKGVVGNVDRMSGGVSDGLERIVGNTNKALKAFGVKPVNFVVVDGKKTGTSGLQHGGLIPGLARGAIVPGAAAGDRVPVHLAGRHVANLESGELLSVANKTATAALMAANSAIPRKLQQGGMVDPAGPGTGVVNPAIAGVVGRWSQRYNAAINYGYDPGGGHVSPGHNVTGTATDTGPAGGWTGASLKLFEQGLRAIVGKVDQVLYGTAGIGTPWPNHGRGNHAHIEWGMHPDVQGGLMQSIARVLLKGPAGPLLDMGQASLDKSRKAANKFLASKMGGIGGGDLGSFGGAGTLSKSQLTDLWASTGGGGNASLMAAIALAESGGDPRAIGHDPGGTTGLGLWQITTGFNDDLIAKYGGRGAMLQPTPNAQAAHDLLGRQGLGAWVVYNTGAYQQFMKEGGILDIDKVLKDLRAAPGPGARREIVGLARERVNKRTALDFLSQDGSTLGGVLKDLRAKADEYATNADFAASLGLTDDDGNLIPGSDVFQGLGQAGWIGEQLGALFGLRNELIVSTDKAAKKSRAIAKILKRIKGPKGLIAQINERIKAIKKRIEDLEDARKDLEDALKKASDNKERSQKLIQAKLDRELEKPKDKQDKQQIAQWRKQLRSKSTEKEGIREDLGLNRQQTREANAALTKQTTVRDTVRGPLSNVLDTRQTALADGMTLLGERLADVQGTGVQVTWLPELPPLGTLKGEIGDAQLALRDLGAAQPSITDTAPDMSELLDIERQLRIEAQQALAVQTAQFDVLRDTPVTGAFAKGGFGRGLIMVGEEGRELFDAGPRGGRVINNPETEAMLAGGGVNVQVIIYEGEGRADVRINDRVVEAAVERVNRRGGRNAARGLAQAGRPAG